ncbi:MAG: hypothetical protein K8W52_46620, partial [Deltaproteobacteria bacterium]|nr:hypothetical protein [Deltaproteobacteria bacterium]
MYQLERAIDATDDLEDPELELLVPGRRIPTSAIRRRFAIEDLDADLGLPRGAGRGAAAQPSGARELDLDLDVERDGAGPVTFDQLMARGTATRVPAAVRAALEAAHGLDLGGVRLWHVPELAHHDMRGLSRGLDIAVADLADIETIEHELGHVLDGEGVREANAFVAGLHFAHDPVREARADRLGRAHREGGDAPRAIAPRTPALADPASPALPSIDRGIELAAVAPLRAPTPAM